MTKTTCGHSPNYAKGLCKRCYMKKLSMKYRRERPDYRTKNTAKMQRWRNRFAEFKQQKTEINNLINEVMEKLKVFQESLKEDNQIGKIINYVDDFILRCIKKGNIIVNCEAGEIYSPRIRGFYKPKININGHYRIKLYLSGEKQDVSVHRVIYLARYGKIPNGCDIDHIDGDKTNNQIINLRAVSRSENTRNSKNRRNHEALMGTVDKLRESMKDKEIKECEPDGKKDNSEIV